MVKSVVMAKEDNKPDDAEGDEGEDNSVRKTTCNDGMGDDLNKVELTLFATVSDVCRRRLHPVVDVLRR